MTTSREEPHWEDPVHKDEEVPPILSSFRSTILRFAIAAFSKSPEDWKTTIPKEYLDLSEVFEDRPQGYLPPHRGDLDATIDIIGDGPLRSSKLYNMTEEELGALSEMLDEQLAKGFISSSTAPHCAPIFFVKTGGGDTGKERKLRLVVDYRELNQRTAKNEYPVPLISQTLTALSKAKIFIKLDLRAGFNNIRIREGDE